MTLSQFLSIYRFQFTGQVIGNGVYEAVTSVIRLSDDQVVSRVKTSIDIVETNDFIEASQTEFSLVGWDWQAIIDQTKRGQLDYFAQRVPITDFFPLNSDTDISRLV